MDLTSKKSIQNFKKPIDSEGFYKKLVDFQANYFYRNYYL